MKHRVIIITAILSALVIAGCREGEETAFARGDQAYQSGDFSTARAIWQTLADTGHPAAQFNLGVIYADGRGTPRDMVKALDWWQKAADNGHHGAQHNLALTYLAGDGIPADPALLAFPAAGDHKGG